MIRFGQTTVEARAGSQENWSHSTWFRSTAIGTPKNPLESPFAWYFLLMFHAVVIPPKEAFVQLNVLGSRASTTV